MQGCSGMLERSSSCNVFDISIEYSKVQDRREDKRIDYDDDDDDAASIIITIELRIEEEVRIGRIVVVPDTITKKSQKGTVHKKERNT